MNTVDAAIAGMGPAKRAMLELSRPDLPQLCEWRAQAMQGVSHFGWHHGYWCPYLRVDAMLNGLSDPNEQVMTWRLDISRALKVNGSIPLSLNDRGKHFAAIATQVAKVQSQVRRVARELEIPRLAFAHVEMHYQPKTAARRDPDNLVPTLKAAIDGLHHREKFAQPLANPWVPILLGDDPRYVSWSQPMIHVPGKERYPLLWLVLRSPRLADPLTDGEPEQLTVPLAADEQGTPL